MPNDDQAKNDATEAKTPDGVGLGGLPCSASIAALPPKLLKVTVQVTDTAENRKRLRAIADHLFTLTLDDPRYGIVKLEEIYVKDAFGFVAQNVERSHGVSPLADTTGSES
jgi:hypothetical protein